MKWFIGSVVTFPLLFVVLLVIPIVGGQSDTGAALAACTPPAPINPPQLGNGQAPLPPGPVLGTAQLAHANIKFDRSPAEFAGALGRVTASEPDFVTLNEVSTRSRAQLAIPGYSVWRDRPVYPSGESTGTAVLWRNDKWRSLGRGRVQITKSRSRLDNRFAHWVTLRDAGGQVVSVIATHAMINPARRGGRASAAAVLYRSGMEVLNDLVDQLDDYGAVLLAGDLNSQVGDGDGDPWGPIQVLAESGMRSTFTALGNFANTGNNATHEGGGAIDYIFFQAGNGIVATRHVSNDINSDHRMLLANFGLVPTQKTPTTEPTIPDPVTDISGPGAAGAKGASGADTTTVVTQVPGFSAEQVRNAQAVLAAGEALNVPPRGIAIGLMTAYGESKLINVDYGDNAGPDSRGIFQQRANGAWGSYEDRMNPLTAAASFFRALLKVQGWEAMQPTLAAHAVQINADAYYYTQYWSTGVRLYGALQGTEYAAAATELANPSSVACAVLNAAAAQTGTGAGTIAFTPSGTAYVGQFTPTQLMARAEAFVAAGPSDPYFNSVNGWLRKCQHFVANLSGRAASGFPTASDGWSHAVATAAAHPAAAADGQAPPVGAWLYFKGDNPAGHVTVYLGNGQSATTDLPVSDRIGIVPADAPVTQWHHTYLGWVAPWAAPGTGSKGP